MECPKCGTWNPDDKIRCWRCRAELPRPPEPRKSRKPSSQTWIWVVAVLFFVLTMLMQCGVLRIGDGGDRAGYWAWPFVPLPGPGKASEPARIGYSVDLAWGGRTSALHVSSEYSTMCTVERLFIGIM
jgi:hypothetical protein